MFRVVRLGGQFYTREIHEDDVLEEEEVMAFVESGDIVILGDDLDEIKEMLGVDSIHGEDD